MTMRFGKHRGEEIADLPLPYLEWLLTEDLLTKDERTEAFTGIALRLRERYRRARTRRSVKPELLPLEDVRKRSA